MPLQIHILGLGGVGKLVASYLPLSPRAPHVTLLLHRAGLAAQWRDHGKCIDVVTNGATQSQHDLEIEEVEHDGKGEGSVIQNLIVATKTHTTTAALRPLRHRLTAESTIVYLQNGMGTIDEVNKALFPISSQRPQSIAGVVNHGAIQTGPFSVIFAAPSNMTLGLAPSQVIGSPPPFMTPESQTLLDYFVEAPNLEAKIGSPDQIIFLQLQKLAVNAVMNPLTSILACGNGEVYPLLAKTTVIKDLVAENVSVLQPLYKNVSQGDANAKLIDELSASAIEDTVSKAAIRTAANTSSMRQDMLAGKKTEIDYINGWIVARAKEAGINCHINEKIVDLVRRRETLSANQLAQYIKSQ